MWDGILWLSLKMKPSFRFFLLFPKISHRKKGIKWFSGLLLNMATILEWLCLVSLHCCTTCANSDIEMAPILMSVALQVGEQFRRILKFLPEITVESFFGGLSVSRDEQILLERPPQIVIGTPGRILQLVKRKTLKLGEMSSYPSIWVDFLVQKN